MRSPISVKIPKRSESAFPNKRTFHFDLTSGGPHGFGTQFSIKSLRVMRRRDKQGRGGKGGGVSTELRRQRAILD
jgi:hypothetical protein